jgi:hypothetical protein
MENDIALVGCLQNPLERRDQNNIIISHRPLPLPPPGHSLYMLFIYNVSDQLTALKKYI